ncbi:hypothetical protein QBC44DRAFT_374689 [Cladorrhinum sp. PSN332]|nr:hypothetical protein QBC44DRAFT_374689 [Cladorrhinum sp. PSN332]
MDTESIIALVAAVVALPPTCIVMVKFYYFVRRNYRQPSSDEESAMRSSAGLGDQTPHRGHTAENISMVVAIRRNRTCAW